MSDLVLLCAASAVDRSADAAQRQRLALGAPALRDALRGGGFEAAFARGERESDDVDETLVPRELPEERWLRAKLAVPESDSIEAFASFAHDVPAPCWRMTPSHVHVGLDHVRLADPAALVLDETESHELALAARPLFAEQGMTLHAPAPRAWFAIAEPDLRIDARSWNMAAGRNIDAYLPAGPDARRWRKLLNEVQMTWFGHPVNLAREARGLQAVNMLWLDGRASAGARGTGSMRAGPTIVARGEVLAGLAKAAGARLVDPGASLPEARTVVAPPGDGDLIVDVDAWSAARKAADPQAWHEAWRRFDAWLVELGLGAGPPPGFERVRAVLTGERRCLQLCIERRGRWRFWRRIDPLGLVL